MKKFMKAFTFVEMMISFAVLGIIAASVINGSIQISKQIEKTRNLINTRKELAVFYQTMYNFSNKSYGAYFIDPLTDDKLQYTTRYSDLHTFDADRTLFNTLYFNKDATDTAFGILLYDPINRTISWKKNSDSSAEILLTNIYRPDYINDSSPGISEIFKFPHNSSILYNSEVPKLIVIECQKKIQNSTSTNPNPVMIPVKLIFQLNTINNQTLNLG